MKSRIYLLGHMNVRMGDFEQYNQSNAAHVPESGIRYKLFSQPGNPDDPHGGIFFHESDVFFNLGYRSYVNDGTFNLTAQYPFDAFFAHAYVGFVNGVNFQDCTFDDERPASQLGGDSKLARGLRSEGARFNAIGCQFYNLLYGIDALGFGETRTFSAKDCVFTDCYVGLSMRGVDNAQATESFFTIGGYNRPVDSGIDNPSLHSGIFIDRSSGFAIEKNIFEPRAAAVNTTIGITAQDTNLPEGKEGQHLDYNEIYNNTFSGLAIGNLANGNNMGGGDGAGGLTYLCNKNTNTPFSNDIRVDDGAVAARQIDPSNVAAGNVFTSCEEGLTHIDNLLGNSIRYYFWDQGTNEEPVCSPAFRVDRIPIDKNECSEDGDIPDEKINIHQQLFHSLKEEFLELDGYYKGLLDDGDTEEVLSLVESTTPANSESHTAQLLSYSPYLSQASALAVLEQQHFTSSQKADILAANPELLYRDAVWNAVLSDSSFTQPQLDELEEARGTSTERDGLEREMAAAYGSLHRAGNQLIRYCQSDTAGTVLDSLQSLPAGKLSLETAYQKADALLRAGDTGGALEELAAIAANYSLSPAQLKEHEYYTRLKELQAALVGEGRNWQGMTEPEKPLVQEVVDSSEGRAAVQAENILMAVEGGNKYYRNPVITSEEQLREPPEGQEIIERVPWQRLVEAFPNPAREIVHFSCRIPEGSKGASLSVFNPAGRLLKAFRLPDGHSRLSWDMSRLPAGLYYYRLFLAGNRPEAGKFSVLK